MNYDEQNLLLNSLSSVVFDLGPKSRRKRTVRPTRRTYAHCHDNCPHADED